MQNGKNRWKPSFRTEKKVEPEPLPPQLSDLPDLPARGGVRSKDLAKRILFYTQNSELLVKRLVALSQGQIDGTRPADHIRAIEILLDRIFGRTPAVIDIQGEVVHKTISDFSDEELRALVDLRKRIIEGEKISSDPDPS